MPCGFNTKVNELPLGSKFRSVKVEGTETIRALPFPPSSTSCIILGRPASVSGNATSICKQTANASNENVSNQRNLRCGNSSDVQTDSGVSKTEGDVPSTVGSDLRCYQDSSATSSALSSSPSNAPQYLASDLHVTSLSINLARCNIDDRGIRERVIPYFETSAFRILCPLHRSNRPPLKTMPVRTRSSQMLSGENADANNFLPAQSCSRIFVISLDLSENLISDDGLEALIGWLLQRRHFICIRVLKLYKNQIAGAGARALAELVRLQQWPFEEIHLSHNMICDDSAKVFFESFLHSNVNFHLGYYPGPTNEESNAENNKPRETTARLKRRLPPEHPIYPRYDPKRRVYLPAWIRLEYNLISDPPSIANHVAHVIQTSAGDCESSSANLNGALPANSSTDAASKSSSCAASWPNVKMSQIACYAERHISSSIKDPSCSPKRCAKASCKLSPLFHLYSFHHQGYGTGSRNTRSNYVSVPSSERASHVDAQQSNLPYSPEREVETTSSKPDEPTSPRAVVGSSETVPGRQNNGPPTPGKPPAWPSHSRRNTGAITSAQPGTADNVGINVPVESFNSVAHTVRKNSPPESACSSSPTYSRCSAPSGCQSFKNHATRDSDSSAFLKDRSSPSSAPKNRDITTRQPSVPPAEKLDASVYPLLTESPSDPPLFVFIDGSAKFMLHPDTQRSPAFANRRSHRQPLFSLNYLRLFETYNMEAGNLVGPDSVVLVWIEDSASDYANLRSQHCRNQSYSEGSTLFEDIMDAPPTSCPVFVRSVASSESSLKTSSPLAADSGIVGGASKFSVLTRDEVERGLSSYELSVTELKVIDSALHIAALALLRTSSDIAVRGTCGINSNLFLTGNERIVQWFEVYKSYKSCDYIDCLSTSAFLQAMEPNGLSEPGALSYRNGLRRLISAAKDPTRAAAGMPTGSIRFGAWNQGSGPNIVPGPRGDCAGARGLERDPQEGDEVPSRAPLPRQPPFPNRINKRAEAADHDRSYALPRSWHSAHHQHSIPHPGNGPSPATASDSRPAHRHMPSFTGALSGSLNSTPVTTKPTVPSGAYSDFYTSPVCTYNNPDHEDLRHDGPSNRQRNQFSAKPLPPSYYCNSRPEFEHLGTTQAEPPHMSCRNGSDTMGTSSKAGSPSASRQLSLMESLGLARPSPAKKCGNCPPAHGFNSTGQVSDSSTVLIKQLQKELAHGIRLLDSVATGLKHMADNSPPGAVWMDLSETLKGISSTQKRWRMLQFETATMPAVETPNWGGSRGSPAALVPENPDVQDETDENSSGLAIRNVDNNKLGMSSASKQVNRPAGSITEPPSNAVSCAPREPSVNESSVQEMHSAGHKPSAYSFPQLIFEINQLIQGNRNEGKEKEGRSEKSADSSRSEGADSGVRSNGRSPRHQNVARRRRKLSSDPITHGRQSNRRSSGVELSTGSVYSGVTTDSQKWTEKSPRDMREGNDHSANPPYAHSSSLQFTSS